MPSSFPTSLDNLTDPSATSKLNSPSHSQQHAVANDAIEKLEAKVGVDGSGVETSLEHRLTSAQADLDTLETDLTPKELTETDAGTVTIDTALHGVHVLTATDLAGDTRALAFSNGVAGKSVIVKYIQGTGSAAGQALTFSGVTWVGGVTPTLVTTAGKINMFGFLMTGETTCLGMPMGDY